MQVRELMTADVHTCGPDTDLATVGMQMWSGDCGAIPVTDPENGRLVGMITDRDIAMTVTLRRLPPDAIRVRDALNGDATVSIAPDAEVAEALAVMATARVRRLPVTNGDGQVAGILSLNDLVLGAPEARSRARGALHADEVLRTLRAVSEHRPGGAKPSEMAAGPDGAPAHPGARGLLEVPGLAPAVAHKLEGQGVRSLAELAALEYTVDRRRHIAERIGLTPAAAKRFAGLAGILRLDGMTERHARVLFEAGIDSFEKLRGEKKDRLTTLLGEVDPDPDALLARWIGAGRLESAPARR